MDTAKPASLAQGAVLTTWAETPAGADAAVARIAACLGRDVAATQRGRNRGLLTARLSPPQPQPPSEGQGEDARGWPAAVTVFAVDASASRSRAGFKHAVALRLAEADVAVSPAALAVGDEAGGRGTPLGRGFMRAAAATAQAARGRAALVVSDAEAAADHAAHDGGHHEAAGPEARVTAVGSAAACAAELRRLVAAAAAGPVDDDPGATAVRAPLRVVCVEHFERLGVQVVQVLQGELRPGAVLTAAANPNGVGFTVQGALQRYPAGSEPLAAAGPGAVVSFATAAVFADQPGGTLGEAHAVLGAVDFSGGTATFPVVEGLAVVDVSLPAKDNDGPAAAGQQLQAADATPGREVAVVGLGGVSTYVVVARRERTGAAQPTCSLLLRPVENAARLVRPLGAGAGSGPWPVLVSVTRANGELAAAAGAVRWSRTRLHGLVECAQMTSGATSTLPAAGSVPSDAFDRAMRTVRHVEAAFPGAPVEVALCAPRAGFSGFIPDGPCPNVCAMTVEGRSIAVAAALEGLGEVLAPLTMWGAEARGPAASRVAAPEPSSVAGRGFKVQPRAVNLLQLCAVLWHDPTDRSAGLLRDRLHRALSVLRELIDYLDAGISMTKQHFPPMGHTPLPLVELGREPLLAAAAFPCQPGIARLNNEFSRIGYERHVVSRIVTSFMLLAELTGAPRVRDALFEVITRERYLFVGFSPLRNATSAAPNQTQRDDDFSGIATSLGTGLVSPRVRECYAPRRLGTNHEHHRALAWAVYSSPLATFEAVRIAALATKHASSGGRYQTSFVAETLGHGPLGHVHSTAHASLATVNAVLVAMGIAPAPTLGAARRKLIASPMRKWPLSAIFAARCVRDVVHKIPLPLGCADDVLRALDPTVLPVPLPPSSFSDRPARSRSSKTSTTCEVS